MKPNSSWEVSINQLSALIRLIRLIRLIGNLSRSWHIRESGLRFRLRVQGRSGSGNCQYGNFVFGGKVLANLLFQQQRFAGLQGERGDSGGGADLQRLRTETGDVEAQIVFFAGDLDRHGAALWPG